MLIVLYCEEIKKKIANFFSSQKYFLLFEFGIILWPFFVVRNSFCDYFNNWAFSGIRESKPFIYVKCHLKLSNSFQLFFLYHFSPLICGFKLSSQMLAFFIRSTLNFQHDFNDKFRLKLSSLLLILIYESIFSCCPFFY